MQHFKTSNRSGVKKKEMALPSKTNHMAAHGNLKPIENSKISNQLPGKCVWCEQGRNTCPKMEDRE